MLIVCKIVTACWLCLFVSCNSKNRPFSKGSSYSTNDSAVYKIGDTVKPFVKYNFDQGAWRAEIKISPDDIMDLSERMPNRSVLITTNNIVLRQIRSWNFIYTESDLATVGNKFSLFLDDSLIASYGIVVDRNASGLQSQKYGWLPVVDSNFFFETIKLFEK